VSRAERSDAEGLHAGDEAHARERVASPTAASIFLADGSLFVPTVHARGPWDPDALHGGAPAALIVAAFEAIAGAEELRVARLGFELLRPVPFAPLEITTRVLRDGRRVQELAAELHADGQLICRAAALRVREVPGGLPEVEAWREPMPGPESAEPISFTLDGDEQPSFANTGMEMRYLDDPRALGPARVWMRLRHPLVPGEQPSPLARAAATADFGNGVSAALPFARFVFINADLHLHLQRLPVGEWIGLDARTLLYPGGTGLAESVLHDTDGPFGRAFQALVVQPR
jgi:hypothetical protein